MQDRFSRTQLLLGLEAMDTLAHARVAVFGIGGVGGYTAEALARGGVGALDLIDSDQVAVSNINRQIIATTDTVGQYKVDAMEARIRTINPLCQVVTHKCFYLPQTADQFDFAQYDYVVDAVDTVTAKLQLIEVAQAAGTPIISCMGAANKLDPTAFRVADIYDTRTCPLAKIIRKECRKRGIRALKVVYSEEPARPLVEDVSDEERALNPNRRSIPGSVSFVPPVAGLICAGEVIKDLIGPTGTTQE